MSSVNPSFVLSKNVCEASCSHHRGIMAESSPFCTASTCDHVTFYLPPPYLLLPSGSKQIRTWQRRRQENVYIKYQIINPKHVLIRDEIEFFFTRPALQVVCHTAFSLSYYDPPLFWFCLIRLYFMHLKTKLDNNKI